MPHSFFRPLTLALGLAFALTACDASIEDTSDVADLTSAEVIEATNLVADALAEDTGGLIASASDLTASVSASGLSDGPRSVRGDRRRPACRGGDQSVSYDDASGTHTVSYECSNENDLGQRSYSALLNYQFRDASGGFVPEPRDNWTSVSSVGFDGERDGSFSVTRGGFSSASTFEQSGEWSLTGLNDGASPALLSVDQQRSGTSTRMGPRNSGSRDFSIEMSGIGIELAPAEDGEGYVATGQITYTLTMEVVRGDRTVNREVEGTIDLDASGRGLLRVFGLRAVYRISLSDGETRQAS